MVKQNAQGQAARFVGLVCGLISASTACQALPEIQWEGQRVNVAAEDPATVCTGSYAYLDAHAIALFDQIGFAPNEVDYYFLEDVQQYCGSNEVGCSDPGVVYSEHIPHLHELVHAREGNGMPLILEEGLATRFGDLYPVRTLGSRTRLSELLTSDLQGAVGSDDYGRAAHFVTYLSETYGLAAVLALDVELGEQSSASAVNEAFETAFGGSIDEILAQYDEYPDCDGVVDVTTACEQEPLVLDTLSPSFERDIDCEAGALGPRFSTVFIEETVELQPTVDGNRIVKTIGTGADLGGLGLIRRCGPCSEGGVALVSSELEFYSEAELPAGRYVVQLMLPKNAAPASLGIVING